MAQEAESGVVHDEKKQAEAMLDIFWKMGKMEVWHLHPSELRSTSCIVYFGISTVLSLAAQSLINGF